MKLSIYSNKLDHIFSQLHSDKADTRDYSRIRNQIEDINSIFKTENEMFGKLMNNLDFRQKLKRTGRNNPVTDNITGKKSIFDPNDIRLDLMNDLFQKRRKLSLKKKIDKVNQKVYKKYSKVQGNEPEREKKIVSTISTKETNFTSSTSGKTARSKLKIIPHYKIEVPVNTKEESDIVFQSNPPLTVRESRNKTHYFNTLTVENSSTFRNTRDEFLGRVNQRSTRSSTSKYKTISDFFKGNESKYLMKKDTIGSKKIKFGPTTYTTENESNNEDRSKFEAETKSTLINTIDKDAMLETITENPQHVAEDSLFEHLSTRKENKSRTAKDNLDKNFSKTIELIVGKVESSLNALNRKAKLKSEITSLDSDIKLFKSVTGLNNYLIRDFKIGETGDPATKSKRKMEMTARMLTFKEDKIKERIKQEREAFEIEKYGSKINYDPDELNDKLDEENFEKIKKTLKKNIKFRAKEKSRKIIESFEELSRKSNLHKPVTGPFMSRQLNQETFDRVIKMRNIFKNNNETAEKEQLEIENMQRYKEEMRQNDNELILALNKLGPPSFVKRKFRQGTIEKFEVIKGKFFGVFV